MPGSAVPPSVRIQVPEVQQLVEKKPASLFGLSLAPAEFKASRMEARSAREFILCKI